MWYLGFRVSEVMITWYIFYSSLSRIYAKKAVQPGLASQALAVLVECRFRVYIKHVVVSHFPSIIFLWKRLNFIASMKRNNRPHAQSTSESIRR